MPRIGGGLKEVSSTKSQKLNQHFMNQQASRNKRPQADGESMQEVDEDNIYEV